MGIGMPIHFAVQPLHKPVNTRKKEEEAGFKRQMLGKKQKVVAKQFAQETIAFKK
jgi:hypothetical protein